MGDNQQMDHYDFINAPQFVDFSDLAAQDDPDADKFFETHREEDDFMIPLDVNTISPTVHLLYGDENNAQYSMEANKAAKAAGLEDVKIEYYASPPPSAVLSQPNSASNKKSLNSVYGTPLASSGASSVGTSFYTPSGCTEDKENRTPIAAESTGKKGGSVQKMVSGAQGQQKIQGGTPSGVKGSPAGIKKLSAPTDSLMSRLNELEIVSSDEEEEGPSPPRPASISGPAPVSGDTTYDTFSEDKLAYLGLPTMQGPSAVPVEASELNLSNSSYSSGDATLILVGGPTTTSQEDKLLASDSDSSSEDDDHFGAGPMEMRSPVNKILKLLDNHLSMDDNDEEDHRSSIVVAPRVGEQVHWTSEEVSEETGNLGAASELNGSYYAESHQNGNSYEGDSERSLLDYFGLDVSPMGTSSSGGRRHSSVGDLLRAIEVEPKTRQFETYGYNPRVGVTIPKTPDVGRDRDVMVPLREALTSSKNACYFEIEAPKPAPKNMRRVSSCSDLVSLQQQAKLSARRNAPGPGAKAPQRRMLTVPRTPDTLKRSQKTQAERYPPSNQSSAGSTSSKFGGPSIRSKIGGMKPAGPCVADRLAAARGRAPLKANPYVSMAEAMIKYQKNTPDRFRSLPKGRLVPEKRATSCDARKRADPSPARSPAEVPSASSTRGRTASFSEKGREPQNAGPQLPKRVELKTTVPKPFNLSCGQRARPAPVVQKDEDVVDFKFKARPAPSKIQPGNLLMKHRPQIKVTQPMSPHFASDDRLKERHQREKRAATKSPEAGKVKPAATTFIKPSRLPTSNAGRSHPEDHKPTTVTQPFSSSFDARQKEILRKKEEKIKQELEEARKGREFHANPVPKYSSAKLPKKKPVEVTHAEPFRLKSDERGAHYQEMLKKKLEEEEYRLKTLAEFHAQPADVIHKPPFEPERPTRVIEGPLDFHLATEKRAQEREHFDEQLREKEREEEERKREEQEMLEELQRQEDTERRRQLVHKAQPFKAPKPFHLKPSAKPLTLPQSPAFSALPSERRLNHSNH